MPKLNIYESKPNHSKEKSAFSSTKFPIGSIVDVAPLGLDISEYTTTTSVK